MLKFDNIEVGKVIKAYDHEPRAWINEVGEFISNEFYLVGRIIGTDTVRGGKVYEVEVLHDATFRNEPRKTAYVPMEMWSDFDERVTVIPEAKGH